MKIKLIILYITLSITHSLQAQQIRQDYSLDSNWVTVAHDTDSNNYVGFENTDYNTNKWKEVSVPHNWDTYGGYRRLLHGNRHGYAWYRKKFKIAKEEDGKRYFLYFEGVGSYATVWLNGKKVGYHAGGRTTFTLDITTEILRGKENLLAVRADHPASIRNLPWVCGGCSEERGFSEGSQPLGIFRPVHLLITNDTRIEPFGVHIWNDTTVSEKRAQLYLETKIKNYSTSSREITLVNRLIDSSGNFVTSVENTENIDPGVTHIFKQKTPDFKQAHLWSPSRPYLYKLITEVVVDGKVIDRVNTPYGIRWISWPIGRKGNDKRFFINGEPFFINGIAEYEHILGGSHAFSNAQIDARVNQIYAAGFNAFRDAHQPHNLRYQQHWDSLGILSWTQLAAHVWFDNEAFKTNFKKLLAEWVVERRNSPSLVLWGLENESTLPEEFARECTELIRNLDPTTSSQRKVTTCNGGSGTDWDVPQNWTGTYGGDPMTYDQDLKKQLLVGEYGAWRTIDFHAEQPFTKELASTEDRMRDLMETKVRLAERVKDSVAGHFFWLFNSHDNPGRMQGGEGLRELDRIGPVNYKGLFTPWDEPTDAYYMFRANYIDAKKSPMVYIVSHTWPNRWDSSGIKDGITIYSNCEEVELFNDVEGYSLGRKKRAGRAIPLVWDQALIRFNVLRAKGYIDGKTAAEDLIVLQGLPQAPSFDQLFGEAEAVKETPGYAYMYRVNCGGPQYIDQEGHVWEADRQRTSNDTWGSSSWTANFDKLPAVFASQRRVHDPIKGTREWPLMQSFRYGREQLDFQFPVPDGTYLVEMYFIEPWFGTGGGMNCRGWRLFDVAINEALVEKNIDIWDQAGHDTVLKKSYEVQVSGGHIRINFPNIQSGQALISAIAIASKHPVKTAEASPTIIQQARLGGNASLSSSTWLDIGDSLFTDQADFFTSLPANLFGAEWLSVPTQLASAKSSLSFKVSKDADVFVLVPKEINIPHDYRELQGYEDTKTELRSAGAQIADWKVYRKRYDANSSVRLVFDKKTLPLAPLMVVPVSNLQSAHDLKTTVTYKPSSTQISNGFERVKYLEKEALKSITTGPAKIVWSIHTGVADSYSMTIRYANPLKSEQRGILTLCASDGTVLQEVQVSFTPSRVGKWSYLQSSTETMVNAGHYLLQLRLLHANDLIISNLEIQ